ncbi:cytochrome c [Neorhizobium sp. NCHU2750]|uniref:c-type cytochrome n=1 Tax=Neorhizobium sp. NCHU2750 TaxID=1825976 RepID=UPI000E72C02A|nr:cytochrome c [Neorhizobium sp. NCHU2750]
MEARVAGEPVNAPDEEVMACSDGSAVAAKGGDATSGRTIGWPLRAVLFLLLSGVSCMSWQYLQSRPTDTAKGLLSWRDHSVITEGRSLYQQNCTSCHGPAKGRPLAWNGPAGLPKAPPQDASGHTWQHPDFALFQLVRDGVAAGNCAPLAPDSMPKFGAILSDDAILAVLSYIKSTWPADIRKYQSDVNTMYQPYNVAIGKLIRADSPSQK